MPLPYGPCDISLDVCCDTFFSIAEGILDIVLPAVNNCIVESACVDMPAIEGYVTMGGSVQDPVPNYLVVSLLTLQASPGSRDRGGGMQMPLWRAQFQVRLLESGWPTAESDGEQIWVPSTSIVHDIARHAYSHGEAMFRALANALETKRLGGQACTYAAMLPMVPIEPSGGSVGWNTVVEVGVPFR